MTVPLELKEAAGNDGCSVFRTCFSVVLPIAVLFLSLQKYSIESMTVGVVKG